MDKIVIKVGSAVLTQDGKIAHQRLKALIDFLAQLREKYQILLVSSGAVASGYTKLKLDISNISNKQALASIGQPLLMQEYQKEFNKYNIICSQVLLEASVFNDTTRLNNAKRTIETLLEQNIIPIINENDVTATQELVFGDNDQLASHITHYFDTNLLVILTDIDGYYDKDPHKNKDAKMVKIINQIDKSKLQTTTTANTKFSTGGIVTKLKAGDFLLQHNKSMFLTSGFNLEYIKDFLIDNNHTKGTIFE